MERDDQRFLPLADVARELNVSPRQALTLVQNGDIRGIQLGEKKIWRVEVSELEAYIQRMYAQTEARVAERAAQPEELA